MLKNKKPHFGWPYSQQHICVPECPPAAPVSHLNWDIMGTWEVGYVFICPSQMPFFRPTAAGHTMASASMWLHQLWHVPGVYQITCKCAHICFVRLHSLLIRWTYSRVSFFFPSLTRARYGLVAQKNCQKKHPIVVIAISICIVVLKRCVLFVCYWWCVGLSLPPAITNFFFVYSLCERWVLRPACIWLRTHDYNNVIWPQRNADDYTGVKHAYLAPCGVSLLSKWICSIREPPDLLHGLLAMGVPCRWHLFFLKQLCAETVTIFIPLSD